MQQSQNKIFNSYTIQDKEFLFYAKDMFYKYPDIENNRTKIKKKILMSK